MPENNDEPDAEMFDPVLDTAQRIVIHQIARRPNDEKIPDILIEDDFGRGPRIGASDNNGERMLRLRRFRAARRDRFARAYFTGREPLVAGLQTTESVIGCD